MLRPGSKLITDPPSKIFSKRTRGITRYEVITGKGQSILLEDKDVTFRSLDNLAYVVPLTPTVIEVTVFGSQYLVVAFFGFNEEEGLVALFALNAGGHGFGADLINGPAVFVRPDGESPQRSAPGYSIGTVVNESPVLKLAKDLEVYRTSKKFTKEELQRTTDATDSEAEEYMELEEYKKKKALAEHIDPTKEEEVPFVEITGEGIRSGVMKRKSSVLKIVRDQAQPDVSRQDPFEEARKQMKFGRNGALLMPGKPKEVEPAVIEYKQIVVVGQVSKEEDVL